MKNAEIFNDYDMVVCMTQKTINDQLTHLTKMGIIRSELILVQKVDRKTRSYVYDRDRGLIDRVASIFQDNPTSEQELYVLAQDKLKQAAEESPDVVARAERNTRLMLVGLLEALGFTSVSVEFVDVAP